MNAIKKNFLPLHCLRLFSFAVFILLLIPFSAVSLDLRITQIDTTGLLTTGEAKAYISITNTLGTTVSGLSEKDFTVTETYGNETAPAKVLSVKENINKETPIKFLLLIDNSGSMYYARGGAEPETDEDMKMSQATSAVQEFLRDMSESNDQVGLAAFNTGYTVLSPVIENPEHAGNTLGLIEKPNENEKYTELYAALNFSSEEMGQLRGRRVVIVLSDGYNQPYSSSTGNPHPEYENKLFTAEEAKEEFLQEGITLFAIHYGVQKEADLHNIAESTGGRVYSATNKDQLIDVYQDIRQKVTGEYQLTYSPKPAKTDAVKLTVKAQGAEGSRTYYAPLILGPSSNLPLWLLPVLFAAGLLLWILFIFIPYEKQVKNPALTVLPTPGTVVNTRNMKLGSGKTVIGSGKTSDITISGNEPVADQAVSIEYDDKQGAYTLVGNAMVNNKRTSKRKLSDGDLISVGGTIIVFDEPEHEKKAKEDEKEK